MLMPLDAPQWEEWSAAAQVLGGFGTTFGVLVATVSAILIVIQVWLNVRAGRSANALETHREYIRLCIQYPELGHSVTMLKYLRRKTFAGILDANPTPRTEKALWFISYILHTMEQTLEATRLFGRPNPHWSKLVRSQLSYHHDLLVEVWPHWEPHYGRLMRGYVRKYLAETTPTGSMGSPGVVAALRRLIRVRNPNLPTSAHGKVSLSAQIRRGEG